MSNSLLVFIRSSVFHVVVFLFTLLYTAVSVIFVRFVPYKARFTYLTIWSRTVVFFAKVICGIRYRVSGLENVPDGPFVVLAKHQSQWETFFLVNLLQPISIVCKRELLKAPFGVGYGISLLNPITIDRSQPKQALKDIQTTGMVRLQEDKMPVLIFPEGTRTQVHKKGKYARSGAALAIAAGVPAVFISLNAGFYWPAGSLMKYPGTIEVVVSDPVDTQGKTAKELTQEAEQWIESNIIDGTVVADSQKAA